MSHVLEQHDRRSGHDLFSVTHSWKDEIEQFHEKAEMSDGDACI